jgi:hypothetical protein
MASTLASKDKLVEPADELANPFLSVVKLASLQILTLFLLNADLTADVLKSSNSLEITLNITSALELITVGNLEKEVASEIGSLTKLEDSVSLAQLHHLHAQLVSFLTHQKRIDYFIKLF